MKETAEERFDRVHGWKFGVIPVDRELAEEAFNAGREARDDDSTG